MDFTVHLKTAWISLGGLCLLGLFFLIGAPSLGISNFFAGRPMSDVIIPTVAGVLMFFVLVGVGAWANWGNIMPKKLVVGKGKIRLYQGKTLVGQIPLDNLLNVCAKSEEVKPNAWITLGLAGALMDEMLRRTVTVAVVLIVRDRDDADTFWPKFFGPREARITGEWQLTHETIARRIQEKLGTRC